MKADTTRRTILRGGLALAGLGVLGVPEWALPLLAQGDTLVPFTDIPENVRWEVPPDRRTLDLRTIDGPFTPPDKFATTQHYGHPDVDPARRTSPDGIDCVRQQVDEHLFEPMGVALHKRLFLRKVLVQRNILGLQLLLNEEQRIGNRAPHRDRGEMTCGFA